MPKTWKKGIMQTTAALGGSSAVIHARVCATLASTLRWVSITPFGVPVEPVVYCSTARSSAATATAGAGGPGRSSSSSARGALTPGGTGSFFSSPCTELTQRCATGTRGSTL